jgi:cell fate (sporulation/competence/biofilm development) regulator YlbF (YheA/YmcA/DUF963 family)
MNFSIQKRILKLAEDLENSISSSNKEKAQKEFKEVIRQYRKAKADYYAAFDNLKELEKKLQEASDLFDKKSKEFRSITKTEEV